MTLINIRGFFLEIKKKGGAREYFCCHLEQYQDIILMLLEQKNVAAFL